MLLHHSFDGEVILSSCQFRVGYSTCCRWLLEIYARHEKDRLIGIVSATPFLFGDLTLFQHLHGASPPRNSMISLWMCWEGLICLRRFGLWIFNCIVKSASAPSYEKDLSEMSGISNRHTIFWPMNFEQWLQLFYVDICSTFTVDTRRGWRTLLGFSQPCNTNPIQRCCHPRKSPQRNVP